MIAFHYHLFQFRIILNWQIQGDVELKENSLEDIQGQPYLWDVFFIIIVVLGRAFLQQLLDVDFRQLLDLCEQHFTYSIFVYALDASISDQKDGGDISRNMENAIPDGEFLPYVDERRGLGASPTCG